MSGQEDAFFSARIEISRVSYKNHVFKVTTIPERKEFWLGLLRLTAIC
jgi:hypothetical protein